MRPADIPSYDDLPLSDFGGRHSWDVPACATVGTLGFIDEAVRLGALRSVRSGRVISLNAPMEVIDPPFFGRQPLSREIEVKRDGLVLDDRIDALYPQVSSQWDALNHIGAAPGVYFGDARLPEQLVGDVNGIEVWARTGIAGRGVLLDLETVLLDRDPDYSPGSDTTMSLADIRSAIERQGVELRFGDILLVYTGYLRWYRAQTREVREALSADGSEVIAAGLDHTEEIARFLWDGGISAIASDNLGVEAWPPRREPEVQPFGFLHSSLIGHLGMAIGELWELDELRAHCRKTGQWDFLLASAPLNVRGAIGSPANALALV